MIRHPPRPTLFPTTPLFRSLVERLHRDPAAVGNGIWSGGHVQRGAEGEDRDVLPGLELALEVLRGDPRWTWPPLHMRSEEHTSELQSQSKLVCRLLL